MASVDLGIIVTATDNASRVLNRTGKSMDNLSKRTARATKRFKGFNVLIGVLLAAALFKLGKALFSVVGAFESLQVRLAAVEGGFDQASARFKQLFDQFKGAPFQLETIADGFVRLRAAGLEAGAASDAISSIVDAVAAFGGSSEELKRATIGFQQVIGKSVLSMEELRQQIGEAIPSAMAIMANEAGESIAQFLTRVQNGMVSSEEAIKLFTAGSKKAFGGFAELLRNTLPGAIEELKNSVRAGLGVLFTEQSEGSAQLTAVIQKLTEVANKFIASLDSGAVSVFTGTIALLLTVIQKLVNSLLFVGIVIADVTAAIIGAIPGLTTFLVVLIKSVAILASIPGRIADKISGAGEEVTKSGVEAASVWDKIAQDFDRIKIQIGFEDGELEASVARIKEAKEELARRVQLPEAVKGLNAELLKAVKSIDKIAERMGTKLSGGLVPFIGEIDRANAALREQEKKLDSVRKSAVDLGSKIQLFKEAKKDTELLEKELVGVIGQLDTMAPSIDRARNAISAFAVQSADKLSNKIGNTLEDLAFKAEEFAINMGSDKLGQELAKINTKFANINQKLDETIEKSQALLDQGLSDNGNKAEALRLQGLFNQLQQAEIANAERLNRLALDRMTLETRKFELQAKARLEEIRQQADTGIRGGLLLGTAGGRLVNEAAVARNRLQQESIDGALKLEELQTRLGEAMARNDLERVALLERTIAIQEQLVQATDEASKTITASGLAQQEFWADVAGAMSNSIGDAINGLIDGTKTLKEVMADFFKSVIQSAIQYIVKLLIIKSLGGLGGGGGFFGSLFGGSAKGNAFPGAVTPFQKGGVINGPTLFGLAGEKGPEAILPLQRGPGGKLGVASQGEGAISLTINAIDQKTGAEFLMKNMPTIIGGLRGANQRNRGVDRVTA